jgi:hypothetical protein
VNEFLEDAAYNFRRASGLIKPKMKREEIEDAVVLFAFGVERVFKGIAHDINPMFVYENDSFDNMLSVLYRECLVEPHKGKVEKDAAKSPGPNHNLLPFKASMLRAARFSKTVEDNIGAFTKLSDYRGVVAHRPLSKLDYQAAQRFLQRLFFSIVSAFSGEVTLPLRDCLALAEVDLEALGKKIVAEDQFIEKLEQLLEDHREQWETLKDDKSHVQKAKRDTANAFTKRDYRWHDVVREEYTCPACENPGIISVEADWDCEGSRGDAWITGIYVSGFECLYCGLQLDDYEQFDYLKMNEYLSGE